LNPGVRWATPSVKIEVERSRREPIAASRVSFTRTLQKPGIAPLIHACKSSSGCLIDTTAGLRALQALIRRELNSMSSLDTVFLLCPLLLTIKALNCLGNELKRARMSFTRPSFPAESRLTVPVPRLFKADPPMRGIQLGATLADHGEMTGVHGARPWQLKHGPAPQPTRTVGSGPWPTAFGHERQASSFNHPVEPPVQFHSFLLSTKLSQGKNICFQQQPLQ
jgi:hypothetical protein